jgi:hypothetical protein
MMRFTRFSDLWAKENSSFGQEKSTNAVEQLYSDIVTLCALKQGVCEGGNGGGGGLAQRHVLVKAGMCGVHVWSV